MGLQTQTPTLVPSPTLTLLIFRSGVRGFCCSKMRLLAPNGQFLGLNQWFELFSEGTSVIGRDLHKWASQ